MSTQRLSDKEQWELFIPQMGYMALLRNLRNFDQAGIDGNLAVSIVGKLADPDEVAKSKQFPYAFLNAYINVPSSRWQNCLDAALTLSVPNIPQLEGRNLILVDTSSSMTAGLSHTARHVMQSRTARKGKRTVWENELMVPAMVDAAALFGIALGIRNTGNVDLWSFASGTENLTALTAPPPGEGVLAAVAKFRTRVGMVGHGTQIKEAVSNTYRGHDRVFIFTDMQSMPAYDEDQYTTGPADDRDWWLRQQGDVTEAVPRDTHVYGFNLAGYTNSSMSTGMFRHEMGGLTDATFSLIKNIENGVAGEYPWQ